MIDVLKYIDLFQIGKNIKIEEEKKINLQIKNLYEIKEIEKVREIVNKHDAEFRKKHIKAHQKTYQKTYQKKYRKTVKENKIKKIKREIRKTFRKEYIREYMISYRKNNYDNINERQKAYRKIYSENLTDQYVVAMISNQTHFNAEEIRNIIPEAIHHKRESIKNKRFIKNQI